KFKSLVNIRPLLRIFIPYQDTIVLAGHKCPGIGMGIQEYNFGGGADMENNTTKEVVETVAAFQNKGGQIWY
ncbi:MAG: hypothetical protein V3U73_08755, partial [bacterium]